VIDRYIAESKNPVLGTKAQVLKSIKNSDLGETLTQRMRLAPHSHARAESWVLKICDFMICGMKGFHGCLRWAERFHRQPQCQVIGVGQV
jgi:hypothetical protein